MKIRGAIFDLDGTLLDSMFVWDTVGEQYLRGQGITPRPDVNEVVRCMSLYQAACYCQSEYGVTASTNEIMAEVNALVERQYREVVQLRPGVAAFLAYLRQRGVKMCVATATDRPLADAALTRCGVRDLFTDILTCTLVGHGKDEPHIYEQALTLLGTPKAETVVFEDALHAARTATAAGFPLAAVREDSEPHQRELQALADVYIEDFAKAKEAFS